MHGWARSCEHTCVSILTCGCVCVLVCASTITKRVRPHARTHMSVSSHTHVCAHGSSHATTLAHVCARSHMGGNALRNALSLCIHCACGHGAQAHLHPGTCMHAGTHIGAFVCGMCTHGRTATRDHACTHRMLCPELNYALAQMGAILHFRCAHSCLHTQSHACMCARHSRLSRISARACGCMYRQCHHHVAESAPTQTSHAHKHVRERLCPSGRAPCARHVP